MAAVAGDAGGPQWVFRLRRYAFLDDGVDRRRLRRRPTGTTLLIHDADGATRALPAPGTWLAAGRRGRGPCTCSPARPPPARGGRVDAGHRRARRWSARPRGRASTPAYVSSPSGSTSPPPTDRPYALLLPADQPGFAGPAGDLPPLIVTIHGGPTSAARPVLDLEVQFWTSRGFAWSTSTTAAPPATAGPTASACAAAGASSTSRTAPGRRHLAATGRVDPARLAIRGGSAGGYTTLSALAFRDVFAAGASYFGVADLEALARDTHKFESRYLDGLIGPYPQARSATGSARPSTSSDGIDRPVILFQGLEDRVVPPEQAEMMVAALRGAGRAASPTSPSPARSTASARRRTSPLLEAELYFYAQVFGFAPADEIEPVEVDGL